MGVVMQETAEKVLHKVIANASGSMVSAYTSFLNFDENGMPFSKWYRGGKKVWFAPLEPGSVVEAASPSGLNYAFHW